MNQDPPILQPIDEKEFFNSIDNHSPGKIQTPEQRINGYMNYGSGSTSPPMPILYQADREPPNILNIQDIFSVLAHDGYNANNVDYSKLEPRKDSDSLFEKIYKDYSTTLTNSSNIIDSAKDSTMSPQETNESDLNYSKPELEPKKDTDIINESVPKLSLTPENNVIKPKLKNETTKKPRRRRFKKIAESATEEDLKKLGVKTFPKKSNNLKSTSKVKTTPVKDLADNKYLKSPFITLRNRTPKKQCQTVNIISTEYEVINPSLRGNGDYQISIYRPNLKLLNNYQHLSPNPCICAFCGKTSEFLNLGSLYGPYFIDTDSISGLPLTCIFPSDNQEDSVVGASGKSAIKTDKNGGLKMVIQSTRSGKTNNAKRTSKDDFRITWEGEVWFHRECILWAPCTFLRGDGKIGGLEEALKMALNAECCVCHRIGAILNCTTKNCEKNFHYYCAISQGSKLNHDQFSMLCSKHKDK